MIFKIIFIYIFFFNSLSISQDVDKKSTSKIPPTSTKIPIISSTISSTKISTKSSTKISTTSQSVKTSTSTKTQSLNSPINPNLKKFLEVCNSEKDKCIENAECKMSIYGDNLDRCFCKDGFYKNLESSCVKILRIEKCKTCEENEGTCVASKEKEFECICPDSKEGENCEKKLLNVECAENSLKVCYEPHESIKKENKKIMFKPLGTNNLICEGILMDENNKKDNCDPGNYFLSLSLEKENLLKCKVAESFDPLSDHYSTQLVTYFQDTNKILNSFNVYCSYQKYSKESMRGLGFIIPNGNDRGMNVEAETSTQVYLNDKPIDDNIYILIGDKVTYSITLKTDADYKMLKVLSCIASSSFMMPDYKAETRGLMINGCPISGESTSESWYWEVEKGEKSVTVKSRPVPIFKFLKSDFVYLHCFVKLCRSGNQDECKPVTENECEKGKRSNKQSTPTGGSKASPAPSGSPKASQTPSGSPKASQTPSGSPKASQTQTVTKQAGASQTIPTQAAQTTPKKTEPKAEAIKIRVNRGTTDSESTEISQVVSSLLVRDPSQNKEKSGGPVSSSSLTTFAILAVVGVCVLMAAVVVGSVMLKKNKKNSQSSSRFAMPRLPNSSNKF